MEMEYEYWWASLFNIDDEKKRAARLVMGCAKEIYEMSQDALGALNLFTPSELEAIELGKNECDPAFAWDGFLKKKIRFVPFFDEEFPERLSRIYDPPYALFVRGGLPDPAKRAVSIVGARGCSEYGRSIARMLGRVLAGHNVPVISGMAMGVDSASHAGALSVKGDTYAVLGGGCDVVYPRSSKNIYENILDGHGGIISEHVPGTQPLPRFFPMRNRIISALSDIVVVVEAREKSGSLITADFALEQGKDIYAVPGRYNDDLSRGTNRLIEQGAGILYDVDNFLKNAQIVSENRKIKPNSTEFPLEKEEMLVYSVLCLSPKSINLIVDEAGLDLLTTLHALNSLMKKGMVQETFQNHFCKNL